MWEFYLEKGVVDLVDYPYTSGASANTGTCASAKTKNAYKLVKSTGRAEGFDNMRKAIQKRPLAGSFNVGDGFLVAGVVAL